MGVDPNVIGTVLEPVSMDVERGRLVAFARATGQLDPVYSDLDAAKNAGHRDLPVPPTFLFAIEQELPEPFQWGLDLGIDLRYVLHGGQDFAYHHMAYAGERLTATSTIAEVYTKRGGALEFVVKKTAITDESGSSVAELTCTIVVRHPEVAS